MTTKKGLQKRRPTTLSCGMLEVQWAVPLVWKAHEQYFITCWMVSLLGVNLVLSLFLLWAVSWFWGRIPLSLAEGYIVLFSDSSTFIKEKKTGTIHRQSFVDSVFNRKAILGKPVQMSFISLSIQFCAANATGSLWGCSDVPSSYTCRHKGCLHLSGPDIHAEVWFIFSCQLGSKTYSRGIIIWIYMNFDSYILPWQIWTVLP